MKTFSKTNLLMAGLLLAMAATTGITEHALAADKLTYMNDWLPGGDKALPFYALQKGLFAAEGIEMTVQTARGSSEAITRIATGSADVGSGGLAALLQARAESNVPVTAVMSVFTVQPDSLFTIEGSPIKAIKDVEGRKIATATFTSSNVIWPLILKKTGIDASSVTLLKVDPAALVPMLATGQVDATINWSTASPPFVKALEASGKKLVILPWSTAGFDGYGYSVYASNKLIADRPEVARRFLAAFVKGMKMVLADPKDVAKAMKAQFPEMDEALVEQQFMTIVPLIENEISKAEGYGTFDKARLAKTWEWTASAQNMPLDKLDPEKVVDRSLLAK
jgi:NitT/TauT family transport system substrate-binding protein